MAYNGVNEVTTKYKQYCIVEHVWRAIRAVFLLIAAALWLYTSAPAWLIFGFMVAAMAVEQLHGIICHKLEKILHYKEQHQDWE